MALSIFVSYMYTVTFKKKGKILIDENCLILFIPRILIHSHIQYKTHRGLFGKNRHCPQSAPNYVLADLKH